MGRLVGIDKLEKDIEHNACSNCKNYNRGEFSVECRLCRVSLAYQVLGWYKEGEEEEIKTGEWIGNELGQCSICGHKGCASDIWNGCNDKTYCPNCGALLE